MVRIDISGKVYDLVRERLKTEAKPDLLEQSKESYFFTATAKDRLCV